LISSLFSDVQLPDNSLLGGGGSHQGDGLRSSNVATNTAMFLGRPMAR